MGFFSASKSKVKIPGQVKTAMNFMQDLIKAPTPTIPTREVTPMSEAEQMAQDILGGWMGQSTLGADFGVAKDTMREFTGPQDITKTPEYEPLVKRTVEEGNLMLNRMARTLQGQGALDTSSGAKMLGRGVRTAEENILATLAPFSEAARNRRLSAAERLAAMDTEQGREPLVRVAGGATYGALPRQISQAEADAIFEQLMTTIMFPYIQKAQIAGSLMGQGGQFATVTGGDPSIMSQIGPIIAAAAMSSDKRLKENIKPIENALAKVNELHGYTFTWKNRGIIDAGVVAQEVEEVLPEATEEQGGYKMVRPLALIGLLVEAINELAQRVKP